MKIAKRQGAARKLLGGKLKHFWTAAFAVGLVLGGLVGQKASAFVIAPSVSQITMNWPSITIPNQGPPVTNNTSFIFNGTGGSIVLTTSSGPRTINGISSETVDLSQWSQNGELPGLDFNDVTIRGDLTITDSTGSATFSFNNPNNPDLSQTTVNGVTQGQITGTMTLLAGATIKDLHFANSYGLSINYSGLHVSAALGDGWVDPSDPQNADFVQNPDGSFTDPNPAVGTGTLPEPSSLVLALAAVGSLAGCGWYYKRRQRLAV